MIKISTIDNGLYPIIERKEYVWHEGMLFYAGMKVKAKYGDHIYTAAAVGLASNFNMEPAVVYTDDDGWDRCKSLDPTTECLYTKKMVFEDPGGYPEILRQNYVDHDGRRFYPGMKVQGRITGCVYTVLATGTEGGVPVVINKRNLRNCCKWLDIIEEGT